MVGKTQAISQLKYYDHDPKFAVIISIVLTGKSFLMFKDVSSYKDIINDSQLEHMLFCCTTTNCFDPNCNGK